MLINQLDIQKFRGVPNDLQLDLSAPLTVLYAPNGTAKTSICDAAEWLLCGHVGRLNLVDTQDVRCRFGEEGLATIVEASFQDIGTSFSLKRTLMDTGSVLERNISNSGYSKVKDQELLGVLVDAIPPNSQNSPKAKISWVRSTRFLESDSLRLLLDSDPESNETQKLIFSSLFGVAEFQKAESSLVRIQRKLPAISTIKKKMDGLNESISRYRKLLDELVSSETQPILSELDLLLSNVEKIVSLQKPTGDYSRETHKNNLSLKLIEGKEAVRSSIVALKEIQESYSEFKAWGDARVRLDKEATDKELEREVSLEKIDGHKSRLGIAEVNIREKTELAGRLDQSVSNLRSMLAELANLLSEYDDALINSDDFHESISVIRQREIGFQKQRKLVIEATLNVPILIEKNRNAKRIRSELKSYETLLLQLEELGDLEAKLEKLDVNLNKLQSSREVTLSELELLLTSGKQFVELHTDTTECPLCEHDHASNEVLLTRIEQRVSILSNRSREEAALISERQTTLAEIKRKASCQASIANSRVTLSNVEKEMLVLKQSLAQAGVEEIVDPERPNLEVVLAKRIAEIDDQLVATNKELVPFVSALKKEGELNVLLRKFDAVVEEWKIKLDKKFNFENSSWKNLRSNIETMIEILKLELETRRAEIGSQKVEVENIKKQIFDLSKLADSQTTQLTALRQNLISVSEKIDGVQLKWQSIGVKQGLDSADFKNVTSDLQNVSIQHDLADKYLEEANELLSAVALQGRASTEKDNYNKEIESCQTELKEFQHQLNAHQAIAEELGSIRDEIHRFVAEEITPLSDIINTLYLRAQGNKFIDSIEAKPGTNGLLDWIAELDSDTTAFDQMALLSQGQRQDLALSIFLARARSLGGTFFMDEPLVHLDDLNRVALLDTLRIIVSERKEKKRLRLVMTTASKNLLRHLREKFSLVKNQDGEPVLRIYEMRGNPKVGLTVSPPELVTTPDNVKL